MLSKLIYKINQNKNEKIYANSASSLFHGFLMEQIDSEYALFLHNSQLKPYSQYLLTDRDNIYWHVNTLNEEACGEIISKLNELNSVYLSYKDLSLNILDRSVTRLSKDKLITSMVTDKPNRYITVKFLTPTAFKSEGQYVFYPSVRRMFQSLMSKFDACSDDMSVSAEDSLNDFENNVDIIAYNLKSTKFYLEGVGIPSFIGEITLRVKGPERLAALANMLIIFGEFSGVGIKSALGMGAIKIIERSRSDGKN